ncbi:hypothetical protein PHYSODRAFT_296410 [Phytophthora sojae]|uniref:SWIM-type domain-containing protein n=1 Tax=Phytophthora sojae (strain P6497) TaxID=1094619 RepID=G4YTP1_PHYSP|nr:hypothetical protein PHYSODRAFT_296410 [Phytophthora sojae]EGZ24269.1 hypothetical protein PHYSODRAFT_296410 [Phytophthora sojae]|eukprot:XP_009519557.1 hypothetical protein PHYSODRAFT_296410 [Phytophthora sojae]
MVDRLDRSRLVFVHMHKTFSSTHSVLERLKALYNLTVRRKELRAAPLPSAGDLPVHLVQVRHRPRTSCADKESEQADDFYVEDLKKSQMPDKSIHVLKMQWQDMPRDGWLVDARLRSCSCRFNMKFGICTHVIHAARELSLHCPGMPAPVPVFVSNRRQTGTTTQSSRRPGSGRQVDGNSHQESSDGRVCPADTNGDPAAHYPEQGPQARPPSADTSHHLGTFHGLPVLGPQPRSPPPVFIEHHIDTESGIREDIESTTTPADMELFRLTPLEAEIGSYEAMLLREREMRSESLSEIRTAYQGANGYQRSYSDSVLHTINVASNYGAAPMTRASSARAPLQVATINAEIASTESFGSISSSRQSCEQTKRRRC